MEHDMIQAIQNAMDEAIKRMGRTSNEQERQKKVRLETYKRLFQQATDKTDQDTYLNLFCYTAMRDTSRPGYHGTGNPAIIGFFDQISQEAERGQFRKEIIQLGDAIRDDLIGLERQRELRNPEEIINKPIDEHELEISNILLAMKVSIEALSKREGFDVELKEKGQQLSNIQKKVKQIASDTNKTSEEKLQDTKKEVEAFTKIAAQPRKHRFFTAKEAETSSMRAFKEVYPMSMDRPVEFESQEKKQQAPK